MKKRCVPQLLCLILVLALLMGGCELPLPRLFGNPSETVTETATEAGGETTPAEISEYAATGKLPPVKPISMDTLPEQTPVEVPDGLLPETAVAEPAPEPVPEPRTPDFERCGIRADLVVGVPQAYRTATADNPAVATFGTAEVRSYTSEPVNSFLSRSNAMQALAAGLSHINAENDLTGYEARTLVFRVDCHDEASGQYGVRFNTRTTDYYDVELRDSTATQVNSTDGVTYYKWSVNWNGAVQSVYCVSADVTVEEKHTYDRVYLYVVPAGYDGVVCGMVDRGKVTGGESLLTDYQEDAYYFFRLT